MIIDVHTHIWPCNDTTEFLIEYMKSRKIWDESYKILSAEGLLKRMDINKINISIVSSLAMRINMTNKELSKINVYVSQEVKKINGRLIGFCTVDPFGDDGSLKMLRECIIDLGHRGLKLHPSFQQFYPNDKRLYPIYSEMQKLGLPILFHTGSIGVIPFKDSYSNPKYIDDIACDFPNLIIIMGHAGRIQYDETVMILRKHKNVYADISTNIAKSKDYLSAPLEWFLYMTKIWTGNFNKVLFGSDYPLYFQEDTLEVLNDAKNSLNKRDKNFLTDADIKNILYLNSKKLVDIIYSFNNKKLTI